MDRLESMSMLLKAVEAGSLSAAARRSGRRSRPSAARSPSLRRILERGSSSARPAASTLTDAGRSYVAACKRILEDVEEAERAAAGEYRSPKGDLTITSPIVFGRLHVLPVVMAFLDAYPEIDIRLVLADRIVNLLEDHIDLAVRIGALARQQLRRDPRRRGPPRDLRQPGLFRRARHAGEPEGPRRARLRDIRGADVRRGLDVRERQRRGLTVGVHSRLIVNTAEAAIDAAIAGIGVTRVLSYQIAAAVRAGKARGGPGGVRAGAVAGQPGPCRPSRGFR